MEAEIITVGDELLYGEIVNSNAKYIGEKLKGIGIEVRWISVVGDRESDIEAALHKAYERAAAIIITGGLGPTHDDRTKIVVSRIHQSDLILNRKILKKLRSDSGSVEEGLPGLFTNRPLCRKVLNSLIIPWGQLLDSYFIKETGSVSFFQVFQWKCNA